MRKNNGKADQLEKYLIKNCTGRDHLTSSGKLARKFNMSRSEMNKLVTRLRRRETPIAGNGEGYFYAENAEEIADTIDFLEHYKAGIELTIAGLRRGLRYFGRKP